VVLLMDCNNTNFKVKHHLSKGFVSHNDRYFGPYSHLSLILPQASDITGAYR
jgi:hypothetical protein